MESAKEKEKEYGDREEAQRFVTVWSRLGLHLLSAIYYVQFTLTIDYLQLYYSQLLSTIYS